MVPDGPAHQMVLQLSQVVPGRSINELELCGMLVSCSRGIASHGFKKLKW